MPKDAARGIQIARCAGIAWFSAKISIASRSVMSPMYAKREQAMKTKEDLSLVYRRAKGANAKIVKKGMRGRASL